MLTTTLQGGGGTWSGSRALPPTPLQEPPPGRQAPPARWSSRPKQRPTCPTRCSRSLKTSPCAPWQTYGTCRLIRRRRGSISCGLHSMCLSGRTSAGCQSARPRRPTWRRPTTSCGRRSKAQTSTCGWEGGCSRPKRLSPSRSTQPGTSSWSCCRWACAVWCLFASGRDGTEKGPTLPMPTMTCRVRAHGRVVVVCWWRLTIIVC